MNNLSRAWNKVSLISRLAIVLAVIPTWYAFHLALGTLFSAYDSSVWAENNKIIFYNQFNAMFTGWEDLDIYFYLPTYIMYIILLLIGLRKNIFGKVFAGLSTVIGLLASVYIVFYFSWGDLWRAWN